MQTGVPGQKNKSICCKTTRYFLHPHTKEMMVHMTNIVQLLKVKGYLT